MASFPTTPGDIVKNALQYLAACTLISCSFAAHATGPTIEDMVLKVDGQPYFIRGMNYSPETRGWPNNALTSTGPQGQDHSKGAWLCSGTNEYDPADWHSACDDNDLTGALVSGTPNNGSYNGALRAQVWDRDLADMQQLGVNTIRLYDVQGGAVNGTAFKSHIEFLSDALQHGIHVIFPVLTTYENSQPLATVQTVVTQLVNETCNNPAILAYNVGNELPLSDAQTRTNIKAAIDIVHSQCPGALVTYTDNDDISGDANSWIINGDNISPALDVLGNQPGVKGKGIDFLMINEYRNDGDGGLSAYDTFFGQIKQLTSTYKIPFAIGETGAYDNQPFARDWYNKEWSYLLKHSGDVNNLGALYFEYTDEPIKKSIAQDPSDNGHQQFMGIVTANWPSASDEENYADQPDNLHKDDSYAGIPSFTDSNGKTVSFLYSNQVNTKTNGDKINSGTGRYTMFSNGTVCNYQTGQTLSPTSGPCAP
jgi:hypothetical protein